MRRLHTALQQYAWGKRGSQSMVAQLKQAEGSGFEIDEVETYAELWMGTHPNGPSRIMNSNEGGHDGGLASQGLDESPDRPGMFLVELLETCPHYLGDQEDLGDLPFMFKVLSIDKALSIQAHPDKKLAERLNATRPDLYKDDNHKPEMAVALSDFEGLCGFRPLREIVHNLKAYPELRAMIGKEATMQAFVCTSGDRKEQQKALRAVFRAFVTANTDIVALQVGALVERLKSESPPASAAEMAAVDTLCCDGHSPFPVGPRPSALGSAVNMDSRQQRYSSTFSSGSFDDVICSERGKNEEIPPMLVPSGAPMRLSGSVDGASDDTVEDITDHEDLTTEDESSHSLSIDSTSHQGTPEGARARREKAGMPTIAASLARKRVPACAFRRRGWSSSAESFTDGDGYRAAGEDRALRGLILRLSSEYPGDIGIMMPLLLNYLRMSKGESFFMAANEPHAYLKGNILEVMARSDNVVRVALTPKYRDVPLLCEILTYNMGAPPIVSPVAEDAYCARYTPPIQDFEMLDIQVPSQDEYTLPRAPVAALVIILAGGGYASDRIARLRLRTGMALFVPAHTPIIFHSMVDEMWICLARSNLNFVINSAKLKIGSTRHVERA